MERRVRAEGHAEGGDRHLNKAMNEVLAMPDIKARFAELGVVAKPSTPDELMALLKADVKKWDDVIDKAGIEKNDKE